MTIYQTSGNPYGHIIAAARHRTITLGISPRPVNAGRVRSALNIWWWISATVTVRNSTVASRMSAMICQQIRQRFKRHRALWLKALSSEGTQKIVSGQLLVYGQSITDPCLSWEDSELLLEKLAFAIDTRF